MTPRSASRLPVSGLPASERLPADTLSEVKRLFATIPARRRPLVQRSGNSNGAETTPTEEGPVSPERPVSPARPDTGKAGFTPLYQWEGVVEAVNGDEFRARVVPWGTGNGQQPEFTEFARDDLSTPDDWPLVVRGAVFYWSLGKERNAAGTITNASLVRFRRLSSRVPAPHSEARRKARELLAAETEDDT